MKMKILIVAFLLSTQVHAGWWSATKRNDTPAAAAQPVIVKTPVVVEEDHLKITPSMRDLAPSLLARLQQKTYVSERRKIEKDRLAREKMQLNVEKTLALRYFIAADNEVSRHLPKALLQRLMVKSVKKGNDPYKEYEKGIAFYIPWSKEAKGNVPADFLQRIQERNEKKRLKALVGQRDDVSMEVSSVASVGVQTPDQEDEDIYGQAGLYRELIIRLAGIIRQHPDMQDAHGNSALHHAVDMNFVGMAQDLIDHGADTTLCNFDFQTPRELAAASGDMFLMNVIK